MHLSHDLHAIDRTLLFHAGQTITPRRLNALAKTSVPGRFIRLGGTSLFADIPRVFHDKRYATILSPARINREIIRHIRKVSLPETIIKELRKIKRLLPYTYRHILRVAVLSNMLCLDKHFQKTYDPTFMARLSLVHDLGKSRIYGGLASGEALDSGLGAGLVMFSNYLDFVNAARDSIVARLRTTK